MEQDCAKLVFPRDMMKEAIMKWLTRRHEASSPVREASMAGSPAGTEFLTSIFLNILLFMPLQLSQFSPLCPTPHSNPPPTGNPHTVVHVHGF